MQNHVRNFFCGGWKLTKIMCNQADLYFVHFGCNTSSDKLVWNSGQHEFRYDADPIFFFNHINLSAGCLDDHAVGQIDILSCELLLDGIVRNTAEDKV